MVIAHGNRRRLDAGPRPYFRRDGGHRIDAAGGGQLLFAFVRHWSRRWATWDSSVAEEGRLVVVSEAVASLGERGELATVTAVADEIGIAQSGASRLIKIAIDAGVLTMATSALDGRRRDVSLTSAGRVVLERAHAWQEAVFIELTAGWSQHGRDDFRRAMTDLMARSYVING